MGREASITENQVHAAANAIRAEGGTPTLRAVRERLGAGSMGTVSKHLQQWKAGQERQTSTELALPPALQRAILDFMATELAAARAPLEAELAEQQQTSSDLAAENERQAATIDRQAAEMEFLAADKAAAEGKAGQLAADLTSAKEESARERQAAELARTELAKALLRLEAMPRMESDLTAIRAELAQERKKRVEAEQQAAVLAAQKFDLDGRLGEIKASIVSKEELLYKAQERIDHLASALGDAKVTIQASQVRIEDLTVQLERARTDAREAGDKAAVLKAQIANQNQDSKTSEKPGESTSRPG